MKTTLRCLVFCFLLIATVGLCPAAENRQAEIAGLINDLNSTDITRRIKAAKVVTRSGFESPELYSTIKSLLEKGYATASDSKGIDEMSWLCKALAASGDYSYAALLNEVAAGSTNPKLQKYARESATAISDYARRKEVMNTRANWNDKLTAEENRIVSMLNSGDPAITRDAAKIIYRGKNSSPAVYDAAEQAILTMLPTVTGSSLRSDTVAWLCKALSVSGNSKYRPTLQKVISSSRNGSLQGHARKALNSL